MLVAAILTFKGFWIGKGNILDWFFRVFDGHSCSRNISLSKMAKSQVFCLPMVRCSIIVCLPLFLWGDFGGRTTASAFPFL